MLFYLSRLAFIQPFILVSMSRFHSYINTATKLIETYKGDKPFAVYIKQFFSENKKYGAKDRRQISSLCYNYFRIGFSEAGIPLNEKMLMGTFLCNQEPCDLLEKLAPEWNAKISLPLDIKIDSIKPAFSVTDIFPFAAELSDGISLVEFCKSFLAQPALFIRVRPQVSNAVFRKLEKSIFVYQLIGEDCIQLANSDKVEEYFILDKEVVVQDYNSQKVLDYLKEHPQAVDSGDSNSKLNLSVWDCCAASGGKSILLHDIVNRKIDLTVSDIRADIILNLHRRFKKAGIKEYKYFIADITIPEFKPGELNFDLVICDAPCSGSGTWSRTPEQLCFFKKESIDEYNHLQKKIVSKVIPYLRKGGVLIYITCSVFKKENEMVSDFISEDLNCKLLHQQLLKGYDKKADNMFVAVFEKL